jgi:DNA-binding Lrp family transcriptional regulator
VARALEGVKKIKGVVESHETTGPYDAILKVKAQSQAELGRIVKTLGTVSGVLAVLTTIVYNVK